MHLPKIENNNVAQYLDKASIIQRTAEQIMKDFTMFGITISFSGDIKNAYQELLDQLVDQISKLLSNNNKKLLSILYQVDISERDIAKTHKELPHYSDVEILGHQIIVRELKKILTYDYFKAKSSM